MRVLGIILILAGIGIWVSSGYLVPDVEHRVDAGPADVPLLPAHGINWWPYIGGLLFVGGLLLVAASRTTIDQD